MRYSNYWNRIKRNLSLLIIIFIAFKVVDVNLEYSLWEEEGKVIRNDVKSYYAYLPAALIYNDLSLKFLNENPELGGKMWPVTMENGNRLIVTSSGMSMLFSPFFLMAHLYAGLSDYDADGYSIPYRFALVFSSLFYLVLGLIFLRKLLKMFFEKDFLVAFVLLAVGWGTNLFYYATEEPAMPHAYNFALISIFAYLSVRWHQKPGYQKTILMGLLFGLIVLVRPTNILVLLFFVLWGVVSWKDLYQRILLFLRRFDLVLLMIFFFLLVWFPQFFYWKSVSGQWLFYSYGTKNAGFFFMNPQIVDILFSYKKGWFVYTPIMFIAFIGIFFLLKRLKIAFWGSLIYILAMIYVLSSWWSWWFGGGFGLRAFVDGYAIMAIPLAALLDVSLKKKWIGAIAFLIIGVLIWYNTFQMRQKHYGAIHWWWMNKEAYWETFLKLKPTSRYWGLIKYPDYDKARKGIYEAVTPEVFFKRKKIHDLRNEFEYALRKKSSFMNKIKDQAESEEHADTLLRRYIRRNLDQYIYELNKTTIDSIAHDIKDHQDSIKAIREKAELLDTSPDSLIKSMAIEKFKREAF